MLSKTAILSFAAITAPALAQSQQFSFISPALGFSTPQVLLPNASSSVIVPINAADGAFWIGKAAGTFCTTDSCKNTAPATPFYSSATSLNSATPRSSGPSSLKLSTTDGRNGKGQQIYVRASDSALVFTAPGADLPADAVAAKEFDFTPEATRMDYGQLNIDGREWWACGSTPVFQIYSPPAGAERPADCSSVKVLTRPYWEGTNFDSFSAAPEGI